MVRFATEAQAKRTLSDIKRNYLHERWDAEIYQSKKQLYTEPNTVRKGTEYSSTEDPPRIEQNNSNKNTKKHKVMKEERVQHKTKHAMLAIPRNIKLRNAKRREIFYSSIRKEDMHIVKDNLKK